MGYFSSVVSAIGNPAWDVSLILFFLSAGFLLGSMSGGKSKLLSFLFATYIALYMSPVVYNIAGFEITPNSLYRDVGVYFAILIAAFIFFERTIFRSVMRTGYRWWQAFLLSFCEVGLFVAGTLNIVSIRGIVEFSSITVALFSGNTAYLFWSAAPFIGLYLISRSR